LRQGRDFGSSHSAAPSKGKTTPPRPSYQGVLHIGTLKPQ
jgi:hypothetical protein